MEESVLCSDGLSRILAELGFLSCRDTLHHFVSCLAATKQLWQLCIIDLPCCWGVVVCRILYLRCLLLMVLTMNWPQVVC
jgi:hypothetical protein